MAEVHYNADAIYGAAQQMNGTPRAAMTAAHKYVESDTQLGALALGVVGMPAMSTYNSMRSEMEGNLKGGIETIQKMADGLAAVAIHYGKANAASTIQAGSGAIPYTPPKPVGKDFSGGETVGIIGGSGLSLTMLGLDAYFMGIMTTLRACGAIEGLALTSVVLWFMFTPDDADINKVAEAWVQVEKQLNATNEQVDLIVKNYLTLANWKVDAATGDNSRQAFDTFLSKSFKDEVTESKDRANKTYTALREMKESLNTIQGELFVYALACFATLVVALIASYFPWFKAAAEFLKKLTAGLLGLGTAGALAAIIAVSTGSTKGIVSMWFGADQAFQPNRVNADGTSTSFSDVNRMNWTWTGGQVRQPSQPKP